MGTENATRKTGWLSDLNDGFRVVVAILRYLTLASLRLLLGQIRPLR
jgi:hypothetical protein